MATGQLGGLTMGCTNGITMGYVLDINGIFLGYQWYMYTYGVSINEDTPRMDGL